MRELKRRKCEFVMLSSNDEWEGILLTSPEEVRGGEIPAMEENIEIAVERAIQASRGLDTAVQLVFGVDPGPRPGLAWLADGIVVGNAQLENIEMVADHIIVVSPKFGVDLKGHDRSTVAGFKRFNHFASLGRNFEHIKTSRSPKPP